MNKSLLQAKMLEHNVTVEEVCRACCFSKTAFYRKLNGQSEFVHSEIVAIRKLLSLSLEETGRIFNL